MIIILFGPPGAGKGTQSQYIVKNFDFIQVSTGNLLREEINKKSILGSAISDIINKGELVSDSLIFEILDTFLKNNINNKKIIFDGYPRNVEQAKAFENLLSKHKIKLDKIFFLKVDRNILKNRISNRVICSKCHKVYNLIIKDDNYKNHKCGDEFFIKRKDDNEEIFLKRFDLYIKDTAPLIQYYKNYDGFCEIDGNKNINEISQQIKGFLNV